MDVKAYLAGLAKKNGIATDAMQFPDCDVEPGGIKVVMINEVVPRNPDNWFYSEAPDPENRRTALGLFEGAGIRVKNMRDILDLGIYVTAALKTPKDGYTADPAALNAQLPLLEAELALFPNLKLVMLMGDVAAKAVNALAKGKTNTRKNVCPMGSAGRRRHWSNEEFYWDGLRLFPSYIMTGKNLLIEPFKRDTIIADIRRMAEFVNI
jgi:uracil-DNA glycosylase